jgi:hypothetical protein
LAELKELGGTGNLTMVSLIKREYAANSDKFTTGNKKALGNYNLEL